MPQRNEPPRPPDGVGRQAIRSDPADPDGRPGRRDPTARLVGWAGRHGWLTVALSMAWMVVPVGTAVGHWSTPEPVMVGWMVVMSPLSLVASIAGLVASWSRRRSRLRSGGRR